MGSCRMVRVNAGEMLLEMSSEVVVALMVHMYRVLLKSPVKQTLLGLGIFCRLKADVVLLFCNTALATHQSL